MRIRRDGAGRIQAFESRGHADFGKEGTDIVCAGVSAVLTTAVLGLSEQLHLEVALREGDGELVCTLPRDVQPGSDEEKGAQLLLETMRVGLEQIARNYPDHAELAVERAGR